MKTFKVILLIMIASLFSGGLLAQDQVNAKKADPKKTISSALAIPVVDLLSADNFVILAYSTITSVPPVSLIGNVGLSPIAGSFITGFSGVDVTGILYAVDATGPAGSVMNPALLTTAKSNLATAYTDAEGRVPVPAGLPFLNPGGGNIGGMILAPGLYKFTGAASITGSDVTLSGNATDVWIFQIGSSLTVGNNIKIILDGGALPENIFWQVGSSATLGTTSVFKGTILALTSISIGGGAVIDGRALASNGAVTMGSDVTITKPGLGPNTSITPLLNNPINSATNIPTNPILDWDPSVGADTYMLQVAREIGFVSPIYSQAGLTLTDQQVTGLISDSVYYWRVRSRNATGVSAWSTVWSFTAVTAPPAAPILTTPSNTEIEVAYNPTLGWNASVGATSYTMQVASNITFTNLVYNQSGLTSTSQQVSGLSSNAIYYWRVNASNVGGTGNWSTIWSFTTLTVAPNTPTLSSPLNLADGIAYNPTVSWNPSDRATSYTMQVATDSDFTNIVKIANGVTSTSQILIALSNNTQYYWRVYAYNAGGASPWSTAWSFTTITSLPQILDLRSMEDFVILAGSAVTAIPPVTIRGNVGLSPAAGSYIAGFNGSNVSGILYVVDASGPLGSVIHAPLLTTAKGDLTIAYNDAANRTPVPTGTFLNPGSGNIGGLNLVPGLYKFTSDAGITGSDVTLTGNATDVWIFQIVSSLNVGTDIHVILAGGAQASNIFWQVGSSATLGSNSVFKGTILADQSITFGTGAAFEGRALAFTGAVTLGAGATIAKPGLIDVPTPPTLIAPINNAINIPTDPTHVWNASSGATSYTLQVARDNGFANMVYNHSGLTSTSQHVTGLVSNMLYYWRVNALNSGGTSGWSTVWSYTITTTIAIPNPPILLGPSNTATGIASNPTFGWNATTGATSYRIQVATDNGFANLVYNQGGLPGTSQQVSGLLSNTIYFWRVNGSNAGGTGDWSTPWMFTTAMFSALPSIPLLSCPINTAIGIAINPSLCWIASVGASSYTAQVATDNAFTNLVYNQGGITSTIQQITGLLNNTLYYWKVNASNILGTSSWSTVWSFTTTLQVPNAPALINPINNSYNIVLNPDLSWEIISGVSGYDLQVSKISDFSTLMLNQTGLTTNNYLSSPLELNTTYYWRVRSKNSAGNSAWSSGMFKTQQTLAAPTLRLPENNSRSNSVDVTFLWSRIENAVYYELIVSTYSDFRNSITNPNTLSNPTLLVSDLENSATYYWKVRTIGNNETSDWSQSFSFSTPSNILAPSLIYPENNSYGKSRTLAFKWEPVITADGYELQITTDGNFENAVSNYAGITATEQSVSDMAPNTTLYWRVRGIKDSYSSNWSEIWNFKTASSSLTTPVITYPVDNSINISTNPSLKWNPVAGSTSYETIISDKADLSNVLFSYILGSPTVNLKVLANNKAYYWKVIARNDAASSEWTAVNKFTTHGIEVGVENVEGIANSYSLSQNYPNPFNPSTVITYTISEPSQVMIKIFNVYGGEVETLVNQNLPKGKYITTWEPKNLTSGVYYYQLRAGKFIEVRKMIYLR